MTWGLNARELDGILITHEHSDHIKGNRHASGAQM